MQRKVVGITLLSLLVLPAILLFLGFKHQQHKIRKSVKHEIMKGIDKESLSLVKVHINEVQNILSWKHAKEFEYHDEMYDVVYREQKGDTMYFFCWWDNEETALNRQLTVAVTKYLASDNKEDDGKARLQQFIKNMILTEVENELPFCPFSITKWRDKTLKIYETLLENELPPPRLS